MHKGKREISHERLSWWMPDALSSPVRRAYFVSPGILKALPGASPRAAEPGPHRVLYWGLHAQSRNYREGVGVDNILVCVCLFVVVNIVRIVTEPNT